MQQFIVSPDSDQMRLDKFLRKHFATFPLSKIYKAIRKKQIKVNDTKVEPGHMLHAGDQITVFFSVETVKKLEDEALAFQKKKHVKVKPSFDVLYEDDALLAVSKPPNIAMHSGTTVGYNNLINQVLTYLEYKHDGPKPAPVHRLDLMTSGVVLIGKTRQAIMDLTEQIRERKVKKYYYALVAGVMKKKHGTITTKLARTFDANERLRVRAVEKYDEGQESVTQYWVEKEWGTKYSLLKLQLITGRTHQIRVHLQSISMPIIGDSRYGDFEINRTIAKATKLNRQFLHAAEVTILNPTTHEELTIKAPMPKDLERVLTYLDTSLHGKKINPGSA